jgi:hypothetical protein
MPGVVLGFGGSLGEGDEPGLLEMDEGETLVERGLILQKAKRADDGCRDIDNRRTDYAAFSE